MFNPGFVGFLPSEGIRIWLSCSMSCLYGGEMTDLSLSGPLRSPPSQSQRLWFLPLGSSQSPTDGRREKEGSYLAVHQPPPLPPPVWSLNSWQSKKGFPPEHNWSHASASQSLDFRRWENSCNLGKGKKIQI